MAILPASGRRDSRAIAGISRAPVAAVGALVLSCGADPAFAQSLAVEHKALTCVVAGRHPRVDACFTSGAALARARVLFRAAATPHWYSVDMAAAGACYEALLPKPKKSTKGIEYYVEGVDGESAEGRTSEYAARVADRCEGQVLSLAAPGSALVRVASSPGAPRLPVGFSPDGMVAAAGSTGGAAAAGAVGAGAAGASGMSAGTIGLIVGGAAVAAGGIAAAAAGGQDEASRSAPDEPPATCTAGQVQMTRVVFDPASFVCPRGAGLVPYSVRLVADVTNSSAVAVAVEGAEPQVPVVATAPNSRGSWLTPTFTVQTLSPRTTSTVQVQMSGDCTNFNTDSRYQVGFMEFAGSLAFRTSCGTVSAPVQNKFRIDFP